MMLPFVTLACHKLIASDLACRQVLYFHRYFFKKDTEDNSSLLESIGPERTGSFRVSSQCQAHHPPKRHSLTVN